jgi:hypothetical protein
MNTPRPLRPYLKALNILHSLKSSLALMESDVKRAEAANTAEDGRVVYKTRLSDSLSRSIGRRLSLLMT